MGVESNASDTSTAASATRAVFDETDVERIAMMDKDVRKFAKLLRDIENLENRSSLDAQQKAKIERKSEAELHFSTARDRAMIRARAELRQRFPGSFAEESNSLWSTCGQEFQTLRESRLLASSQTLDYKLQSTRCLGFGGIAELRCEFFGARRTQTALTYSRL